MVDIICMVFSELWATGDKRKIQNENINETAIPCFPAYRSNHSITLTVQDLRLKNSITEKRGG